MSRTTASATTSGGSATCENFRAIIPPGIIGTTCAVFYRKSTRPADVDETKARQRDWWMDRAQNGPRQFELRQQAQNSLRGSRARGHPHALVTRHHERTSPAPTYTAVGRHPGAR